MVLPLPGVKAFVAVRKRPTILRGLGASLAGGVGGLLKASDRCVLPVCAERLLGTRRPVQGAAGQRQSIWGVTGWVPRECWGGLVVGGGVAPEGALNWLGAGERRGHVCGKRVPGQQQSPEALAGAGLTCCLGPWGHVF